MKFSHWPAPPSQFTISVVSAIHVINLPLEDSLVLIIAEHHGRLQNSKSLLLGEITGMICIFRTKSSGAEVLFEPQVIRDVPRCKSSMIAFSVFDDASS